ncbi:MAG: Rieske 2Fe-2S domain-containing protein [Rhodospirillaceae bacterium]|nr:Rieske 2Fe-2S domain-containing protein [Rhodospirillaceae bacterium]
MNDLPSVRQRQWLTGATTRVPYWVYRDPAVYAAELEKIFYGNCWHFVGFSAEIPAPGDFRRVRIGEKGILVLRGADGGVNVLVNRCAHRGAELCAQQHGNMTSIVCPYHNWTYDLSGNLKGVPFRRGLGGKGGMPETFAPAEHGLRRGKATEFNGAIFASLGDDPPAFADYMGPRMLANLARVFDGREIRILGYQRQRIGGNWKLMMENIKDPYHAGLLHLFLVSFGLFRTDQEGECAMEPGRGHASLASKRSKPKAYEGERSVRGFDAKYALEDRRLIDPVMEFADDVTLQMQTVFPSLIVQAQSNTLATRLIIPRGHDEFELSWTFFGYAGDDEARTQRRIRQANLMGAAGFVSVDDTEMMEFSRRGIANADDDETAVLLLGGEGIQPTDHLVTEAPIREFYEAYARQMGYVQAE